MKNKLGPVATYEVISSWIESAKTQDHLDCVEQFVEHVFTRDYPISDNPMYHELFRNLTQKRLIKEGQIGLVENDIFNQTTD